MRYWWQFCIAYSIKTNHSCLGFYCYKKASIVIGVKGAASNLLVYVVVWHATKSLISESC